MSGLEQRIRDNFAVLAEKKQYAAKSKAATEELRADLPMLLADYEKSGGNMDKIEWAAQLFGKSKSTIYRLIESTEQRAERLEKDRTRRAAARAEQNSQTADVCETVAPPATDATPELDIEAVRQEAFKEAQQRFAALERRLRQQMGEAIAHVTVPQLTNEEYRTLLAAVHPDCSNVEKKSAAFQILKDKETLLRDAPRSDTPRPTLEELMATLEERIARAAAVRKAQRRAA